MRRRTYRRAMTGMIKSSGLLCGGGGEGWTETASSTLPSPAPRSKDPKKEAEVASLACFSSNPAQSITEPRGDQDLFCISSYLGRLRVKTDPPFNTIPAITYPYWFLPGCFSSRPLSNKEFPPLRWNEVKSPWNAIYCTLDLVGGKHCLGKMFCFYVKSDISPINKGNNLMNC